MNLKYGLLVAGLVSCVSCGGGFPFGLGSKSDSQKWVAKTPAPGPATDILFVWANGYQATPLTSVRGLDVTIDGRMRSYEGEQARKLLTAIKLNAPQVSKAPEGPVTGELGIRFALPDGRPTLRVMTVVAYRWVAEELEIKQGDESEVVDTLYEASKNLDTAWLETAVEGAAK